MLYYLDILPVPDHLRAYIQNEESSSLNYAVNTNDNKCQDTIKDCNTDKQSGFGDGKGHLSKAFETGVLGSKTSSGFKYGVLGGKADCDENSEIREKKPSQIPRLVRSKSSPHGFEGLTTPLARETAI